MSADFIAIDMHVHVPTEQWLDGSLGGGYLDSAQDYFRSQVARRSVEQLAHEYGQLGVLAVVLAWDAETGTGRPRLPNEVVAAMVREHPGTFIGFASVDPHKGQVAVDELRRAHDELGLVGLKLHPSLQAFRPDDPAYEALWSAAEELRMPCVVHTGTSGIGAGRPGGMGVLLDFARPIHLDAVAARHPGLTLIAAHFGWPWHLELIAMCLHKSNLFFDLSGWAPRYLPPEIVREISGRLRDQVLFGSDYPFLSPERCLKEIELLDLPAENRIKLLSGNASRVLRLNQSPSTQA